MLAIKAARAFDGERRLPGGAVVLVDDGRIAGVLPAAATLPAGCVVTELPDATLLPGLIDTHVHLCGDGHDHALDRVPDYRDDELADVIETALTGHLAAGVTTVRDLGDHRWAVLERRDRAAGAGIAGPTILASGPPITSVGGHCWSLGGEVTGAAQLRAAIRQRAQRRVDVVKVMASGGVATTGTDLMGCQFALEDLRLLVDDAHAAGLAVTAHAHGLASVQQAIEAGVDGIEHCACLTPSGIEMRDSLLESLAQHGISVCPTLATAPGATPSPIEVAFMRRLGLARDRVLRHMGRMHRAGVQLVAGTDGGIAATRPHGIAAVAVGVLVAGGVPVPAALASATSVAARVCGLGTRKGLLRAGYDADLLVVNGDPLTDIRALARPVAVMVRGHWVAA